MGICNLKIISIIALCIISINLVFAFGITSPYYEGNPLKMTPGQTSEVAFLIGHTENDRLRATVTLEEDGGIAELIDGPDYTMGPGESKRIYFKISVPEDAEIGDTYNVRFSTVSSPIEEGTVQIGVRYNSEFLVQVVEDEEASQIQPPEKQQMKIKVWVVALILVILIAILIYFIIRINKKHNITKVALVK